jgi:predicted negative regulator of RcsB-dependent stress response
MFGSKATRWFGILFLLMLALRIGYKYYRTQQPSAAEEQMTKAQARSAALIKAIQADQERQRANGATAVRADSTLVAADTTAAE